MIFNLSILLNLIANIITTIVMTYVVCLYTDTFKKERIKFITLCVSVTTIVSYITSYLIPSLSVYSVFIQAIIFITCGLLTIKNKAKQVIISCIITFLGAAFIEIIVSSIWTKIVVTDLNKFTAFAQENLSVTLLMVVLWLFIALIIYTIFYYVINYLKKRNVSKYLPLAILFPLTQMICLLFSYNIIINMVNIKGYIITLAVISILSVVADIVLFSILKYLYDKDILERNNLLMEKELKLERNYYSKVVSDIENTNKIRHDIKNQLQSVYILLEKNNEAASNEMIKDINKKLSSAEKSYCNNDIVEAVMLEKGKTCNDNSIKFKTDIVLNDKTKISKLDLCSIFSNIMDNAIEASSKTKKPYINLEVSKNKEYIIINEKNNKVSSKSCVKRSKSLVKEHGVGLTILKDIANKYDGKIDIKNDENSYEITLWLKDN